MQANQTSAPPALTATPSTTHCALATWTSGAHTNSSIVVHFLDDDKTIPALYPIDEEEILTPLAFIVDVPLAEAATVTCTFEGVHPTVLLMFLNSGASDHFFRNKSEFTEYEPVPYRTGTSALSSEGEFSIVGKGTVVHVFKVGGKKVEFTFKNTLHAPSLTANLISVSQFNRCGYFSLFSGGEVIISQGKSGQPILHSHGSGGMYILEGNCATAFLSTSSPADLDMWHRCFAHADVNHIHEMANKGLVDDLVITNTKVNGWCLDYLAGRQHACPYDNPTDSSVPPLGLVAMDLWGPSCVASPGGNIYMMIVVDSGLLCKYSNFLCDKSDNSTIKVFNEYQVLMETQTGRKIKRVRTDNAFNLHV